VRVRILGQYYNLRFVPNLGGKFGECDHPKKPQKEIRIQSGLSRERLIEILIHEGLHGGNWHLDEEFVDQVSADIAKIICNNAVWERITDG
jgi:hypothetical protein